MKKLKLKLMSKYSLVFILTSILTFGYFLVNGKSFVWHLDGYAQHNVALMYYGTWLRDIIRNIFIEHTFTIPMWDFSIGYGGDIITTLNYYVLGEPLNLLSVFVSPKYIEYLYAFLIILRLYLSGLFFMQFCKIMNKRGNGVVAGALVYVFTGYTMWAAVRHPFFILPIMFFPLMLTGVEKILKGKKPYQFIFTIVLCAISNFYFFYMVAIFTVIYTLIRCGFLYKKEFRKIVTKLGTMLLYAIVAIMISAVIFLPIIIAFLGDNRNEVSNSIPALYDLRYYQKLLSTFISADSGGYWNYMGYSPIVILGLFFMFQKKKMQQYIFFGIGLLFMAIPAIGSLMNGLSYISNRWIWAFAMFCAFILVEYWNDIISIGSKYMKQLFIVLTVYCTLVCLIENTRMENTLMELLLLVFTVMILGYMGQQNRKFSVYKAEAVLVTSVILGVAINSFYVYSVSEKNYVSQFIDRGNVYESYRTSQSGDIKNYIKDDEFFRFSSSGKEYDNTSESSVNKRLMSGFAKENDQTNGRLDFCDNATMLFDVNGIGFYWSLGNSNVSDYLLQMDAREYSTFYYHGIDDRPALLSLSSVKYYISEEGNNKIVPYGFRKYKTIKKSIPYGIRNKKITKDNRSVDKVVYNVYINDFALPLGYTYNQTISEEKLAQYTGIEKEEIMLQAAIVDKENASDEVNVHTNSKELDYKITSKYGLRYENNRFVVISENASAFVEFQGAPGTGLFAYIKNLEYKPINPLSQHKEQLDSFSTAEQNLLNNRYKDWVKDTNINISFSSNGIYKNLTQYADNQSYYNGKTNYAVNLGYSESGRVGFYISFYQTGIYSFDELKVVEQSFDNYKKNIRNLKQDVLSDVIIKDNEINGKIELEQKKLLCLNIPYNNGWKIYIDGKGSSLQKVNYMNSGVFLEPGTHEIQLKYCTPGLQIGILITGVGIIILFGIVMLNYRKERKR